MALSGDREGATVIADEAWEQRIWKLLDKRSEGSDEEGALRRGVWPVRSLEDLRADLFDSDDELEEFLFTYRAERRSGYS